jgi:hypothetical protein
VREDWPNVLQMGTPAARDRAQNERYGLHCRIAETAGVSIGSVYQYFANHNTLFVALHERHVGWPRSYGGELPRARIHR